MVVLNHAEFKRIFRFSKADILALVDLLYDQLHFDTGHGSPLSVLQQVLVALNHSSSRAQQLLCRVFLRVSTAICQHKARFLKMPTEWEICAF